ncbi:cytidylate kinase [Pseudobutyrivibrio sp. 49]|uniref:(d)CMP kinase n=1 Tax=unclassified Pseudobutyrivibrio TaxID=2638619 RepID=UPI000889FF9F|nr:(d)CMP kinase [Pseudobutyrivibrio sp. 49]SDH46606.1 cytidylate kinase [Pseudobutyrivibrio sp. 49]SFN42558.1 cytidylate kinase [Pseudobutyrivibrio sp. UC1225]
MAMNVAIDGPAGAGKSTIAKAIAKKLGYVYVDTGAMYRAMALFFLRSNIAKDDEAKISSVVDDINVSIKYEDGAQHVILNGEDVTGLIRTEEVGNMASATSVYGPVRTKLVALQQELAKTTDVIMDGRDIGTVVLPNADVKVFLTASVECRAKRRYDELVAKGLEADFDQIAKDIEERDYRDSHREISPLKQADDASLVDSSNMTIDEVVEAIINLCNK